MPKIGSRIILTVGYALLSAAAWVLGLPLVFWHRFPRVTNAYVVYAIGFILLNQISHALLGECFLTALARACWQDAPGSGGPGPIVRLRSAAFDDRTCGLPFGLPRRFSILRHPTTG